MKNIAHMLTVSSRQYRSRGGAKFVLIFEGVNREVYATNIKQSFAPNDSRGFHEDCKDIEATNENVIFTGSH